MMIVLVAMAIILLFLGIVILAGKGDNLIAGYNTSSREEKNKYDVKRLRLLTGGVLIVLMPTMFLLAGEPSIWRISAFCGLVVFLSVAAVILANTWAKR